MRFFAVLILSGIFTAGQASAMPLPDCASEVTIANAHVAQVQSDGTLILDDGRAAILEGIRLPGTDSAAAPIAQSALQALHQLAIGAPLILTSSEPRQDRYGRLRVQAFDHVWLQIAL